MRGEEKNRGPLRGEEKSTERERWRESHREKMTINLLFGKKKNGAMSHSLRVFLQQWLPASFGSSTSSKHQAPFPGKPWDLTGRPETPGA